MLDDRARKFDEVSAKHFGYDRSEAPGAGAAGGLGYVFLQYFNGGEFFRLWSNLMLF